MRIAPGAVVSAPALGYPPAKQQSGESMVSRLGCALLGVAAALAVVLPAAATDTVQHHAVREGTRVLPKRLLLLPPDLLVQEVTAGGVIEKVPQRTLDAANRFRTALAAIAAGSHGRFEVVPVEPAADEKAAVSDFLARYAAVASGARQAMFGGPAWEARLARFDYTLGEGLPAFAQRHGADAVLVTSGSAMVQSTARAAFNFLGGVATALLSGGTSAQVRSDERGEIAIGVVDLASGDLLWLHSRAVTPKVFENDDVNRNFVEAAFETYGSAAKP
jgi:hypothetical protein